MTLQQLRVLVAVVDARSFTRGARSVFMTQSAASQHVRSLELSLGVPLVERTAGAVLPTRAGEGLLRYARDILRTAGDAERYVGAVGRGRAGRLVIGASGSAVAVIPALVAALRAAAPGVEVALRVASRPEMESAVGGGAVDAAALSGPVRRAGVAAVALCADRLVLVAAPGTPLLAAGAPAPVPIARLAEQPLIAPAAASSTWRLVSSWAERAGVELRPEAHLDGGDAVKRAVEAGLGVALLSAWLVEREVALGTLRLVPLDPAPPARQYELARRAGREPDGALSTLLRASPEHLRRRLPAGVEPAATGGPG